MRRSLTGLAVAAVALTLAGCTSYPGGVKDSECRYGQSGDQPDEQGAHCLARPAPRAGVTAAAVSGRPLARALAAFRRTHPGVTVSSIGINRWAETTFDTASAHAMTTYDQNGRTTSGQNDYVYDKTGSFPLAAAADGSGLCRGANPLPGSPAHLSPAIPTCPSGVLPIEFTAD